MRMRVQGPTERVEVAGLQRHVIVDEVNDIDRLRQQVDSGVALARARRRAGISMVVEWQLLVAPVLDDVGRALRVIAVAPVDNENQSFLCARLRRYTSKGLLQLPRSVPGADYDRIGGGGKTIGH
jgi:hypothetical protein